MIKERLIFTDSAFPFPNFDAEFAEVVIHFHFRTKLIVPLPANADR
jgi:hypothetical protein